MYLLRKQQAGIVGGNNISVSLQTLKGEEKKGERCRASL